MLDDGGERTSNVGGIGGKDFSLSLFPKKLLSSILYLHLSSFSKHSFDFKLEFEDVERDEPPKLLLLVYSYLRFLQSSGVLRDKRFKVVK